MNYDCYELQKKNPRYYDRDQESSRQHRRKGYTGDSSVMRMENLPGTGVTQVKAQGRD